MPRNCIFQISAIVIGIILLGQHSSAWAQEERVVELPVVFSQEGTGVKTSICLRVRQTLYGPDRAPWVKFKSQALTSPEKHLTETIAAIVNRDINRLRELSHPLFGRDARKFQRQANAYFRQFGVLKIEKVWGYLRFNDLLVFFLQIDFNGTSAFVDFLFARQEGEDFGFLPYKTSKITYRLVSGWFNSDWGLGKNQSPIYCMPSLLEQITHMVVLDNDDESSRPTDVPSELLLRGTSLTDTRIEGQPYGTLRDKISTMKDALKAGRMGEYFDGFTEGGRKRVEDWFSGAQEKERQKYIASFVTQEPFYVFNGDPLWVVYTRTGSSGIQALYFVRDQKGQFLWANAAYGSTVDRIFKSQRFIKAASEETPFDSWKIAESKPVK